MENEEKVILNADVLLREISQTASNTGIFSAEMIRVIENNVDEKLKYD